MMNINNLTHAHRLMCQGAQQHTLDVAAARERKIARAQNRDRRTQRRLRFWSFCVDAALTVAISLGIFAAIRLLTIAVQ